MMEKLMSLSPDGPKLFYDRYALACKCLALVVGVSVGLADAHGQVLLSDFSGTGFDYTFGFTQTTSPTSVRLTGPTAAGGGGTSSTLDLSPYENGRLSVDFSTNAGNNVDQFLVELIDVNDITGKWAFNVSDAAPGVPTNLVSASVLGSPQTGEGNFENLDLSQIKAWQVLGDFSSSGPFDLNFDKILIDNNLAAPPPYAGFEPDAPWRAEAATRIDANRKSNAQFRVVDTSGLPLSNATIEVRMQEHEFGFGSAVQAFRLRNSAAQHETYKQKTAELFNLATLENNLKWPAWEGEFGGNFTQQGAIAALDWLADQGIEARGHALVWPGINNLPDDVGVLLAGGSLTPTEQQQLRDRIAAHLTDILSSTDGRLVDWDVVNEPRANHDIMDQLSEGDLAMVSWFQQVAAATSASLYLNEFDIIASGGSTSSSKQDEYFDTVQFLLDNNAPIDGIGFQGHFNDGSLTGPEQLWAIIDRFAALGLEMQVTEFDFNTTDEQLQAAFTRDFLTAMFAHEDIDDIILWGFWEEAHFASNAALYRSDWSIKPNGEQYNDLVFNQWWTDEDLTTDAQGETTVRGFKGDYQVTVDVDGQTQVFDITLSDDGTFDLVVEFLAADFDNSGTVDELDLEAWGTAFGSGASGDADQDGDSDGADFLIWQRQLGLSSSPATAAAVPEPSGCLLLVLATLTSYCWTRRSS